MYNITIISTVHTERGKCNSYELYKIVESISPEVIFEELSPNLFNLIYNDKRLFDNCLETKCINNYQKAYKIKHVPVDIEPNQKLTGNIEWVFNSFKNDDVYRVIDDEQILLTEQQGFAFLNSEKCQGLFDQKMQVEKKLLELATNVKNEALNIYTLLHDEINERENAMIENIYRYSEENDYNQAVFLIGAGHRKSMIQKISEFETKADLKLNWTFYNPISF